MSNELYNSRTADKFVLRLPDGMREKVEAAARARHTSMNTLMIQAVDQMLHKQQRVDLLLDALELAALQSRIGGSDAAQA
ncbi:MAG: Arc family DNA-binding protein [Pseudomonas qingdaonensis]|uniref:Arc family DNA-binding protein n=1 Tax=Pseudomonas qingdaonensis TaxID=2056231 RepID=UPI0033156D6C